MLLYVKEGEDLNWREKSKQLEKETVLQPNWEFAQRMHNAVSYIENNLTSKIDYEKLAQIVCCSQHQFGRYFSFLAKISVTEYIRRRRLTLASFELQTSQIKVIDLAYKYGYNSPESFARAFKNLHGVSPTLARQTGSSLKAFPSITFQVSLKGEQEMNYKIEQKPAFALFGTTCTISTTNNENFKTIPQFWNNCEQDGTLKRIKEAANLLQTAPLHAATFHCTEHSHDYLIGTIVSPNTNTNSFTTLFVPCAKWAIFSTEPLPKQEAAQETAKLWKRIFTEWFATSGFELEPNTPEIEFHLQKENNQYVTEIWVPILNAS